MVRSEQCWINEMANPTLLPINEQSDFYKGKQMVRISLAMILLLLAPLSHASPLARGTITLLESNTSSTGSFALQVDGAGGYPCNGNPIGIFQSNFPDQDSFKRAFTIASLAFAMGKTVELYNSPASASCPYIFDIRIVD